MNTTQHIPPETVADLLDAAATLIETQGLLRHESWTDRHEHGAMGASTAIYVAATGRVQAKPMPADVYAATQLCAYAVGDLDTWADNAAADAAEVVTLLRYIAQCEREVDEQAAIDVAGTRVGDIRDQGARWRAMCAEHRSPYATPALAVAS